MLPPTKEPGQMLVTDARNAIKEDELDRLRSLTSELHPVYLGHGAAPPATLPKARTTLV